LLLNASMKALSVGFPGLLKSSATPWDQIARDELRSLIDADRPG
jgi:hypothetical protein